MLKVYDCGYSPRVAGATGNACAAPRARCTRRSSVGRNSPIVPVACARPRGRASGAASASTVCASASASAGASADDRSERACPSYDYTALLNTRRAAGSSISARTTGGRTGRSGCTASANEYVIHEAGDNGNDAFQVVRAASASPRASASASTGGTGRAVTASAPASASASAGAHCKADLGNATRASPLAAGIEGRSTGLRVRIRRYSGRVSSRASLHSVSNTVHN